VGARETAPADRPPDLQALPGGGRAPGGQPPLLLPVPHAPQPRQETAAPPRLDARLLADRLTDLYGVPVRRDQALRLALDVLGDHHPHDPTTTALDTIAAAPERYRPQLHLRRAAGAP
jgi:hypothetical protein